MLNKIIVMGHELSRVSHSITLSNLIKKYMKDIFDVERVGVLFHEHSKGELFSLLSTSENDPLEFTQLKYSDNVGISGQVCHNNM